MKFLRRLLGLFVMLAGLLGLVISIAGLAAVWQFKPVIAGYASTTIDTLTSSIGVSQKVMEVTGDALGATVDSVDALSNMLGTTADSLADTRPVLDQVNLVMGETVPSTLGAASDSLKTAQQAAAVLDSAIKSLDSFRFLISPLVGGMPDLSAQAYNPEVPLADSLGDLAASLEDLPATFTQITADMEKAGDNLESIQGDLTTMSDSVKLISNSLNEYRAMIGQSQSSMDNLAAMLTNIQNNLVNILNWTAIGLSVFLVWLLVIQIVIFSQGWELFQGTAGRMEGGAPEEPEKEPEVEPAAETKED
ncbi:MAG: hypothetical protein JXB15_08020 [Anaerolineales bacterium]|nr:hypothetical protein [Anaerolineales bacterium]